MTPDDATEAIQALSKRIEVLEEERKELSKLPVKVGELRGLVEGLQAIVVGRFDIVQTQTEKLTSPKYVIQFAGAVVVPILIALLGGYFVLKAGTTTP